MAGIAVHDSLKEFGLSPDIKWVNDVFVNDKKISGILAEAVETPTGLAVIVGIGINLTSENFPAEIAATATSIEAETGNRPTPDDVAKHLTGHLSRFYQVLNNTDGIATILEEWRRRSSYHSGKSVRVTLADDTIEGITDGLEANGALRVKLADGSVHVVQAGDVERLREA